MLMNNFSEKVSFIWSVADLIRDTFKRSKYQDVILPLTVLRRIDCVLQPTKEQVLDVNAKLKGKLENLAPQLRKASGYAFYNTSLYDFERLLSDAPHLAANLRAYINGFSDNMREVLEKFDFNNTIAKLEEAGLLFLVMEKFKNIDLHPDVVPNLEMGYIFEELIRKFNEALNENPGEHFTDLATSKKKQTQEKLFEESVGHEQQQAVLSMLKTLPGTMFKDRAIFEKELDKTTMRSGLKLTPPLRKAILTALSERDETAEICSDKDGNPEPDPELRDTENVPLKEDIWTFFEREVQPHVPDAWINTAIRDHKDGEVGRVGYEINFNRYFYKYQPPRPLEEIEADIKTLERDILEMLREVAG
jgi:HsdM N-terminal domain